MSENKPKENAFNIELKEEVAEGVYTNLVIVSHSPNEFVLDFVRMMPNVAKGKVKSRIIVTPDHAKRLLKTLADNINKYESQFGPIDDKGGKTNLPPMSFNTPAGQA
jgi:hypothetical protein